MQLPIDESRHKVHVALQQLHAEVPLVLSAPTGSGKSTRLPVWCIELGLGPVLVVEPRRVACRTLAHWVAQELSTNVGDQVGYAVRFEHRYHKDTTILFVTPGVARRMLLSGTLKHYPTVIVDEFHERSWETDVIVAALTTPPRSVRLILMSATLTADRLVTTYQAQHITCSGRSYPISFHYQSQGERLGPSQRDLTSRVLNAINKTWNNTNGILVFLPGLSDMLDVRNHLHGIPVYLLHGSLAGCDDTQAFDASMPRVVLATNVAESSLTLPGITAVIDSGLEKRPIHSSGFVALATVPIAQASADQRAGRAGRTAPGQAIRLWDAQALLETAKPPELLAMELDEVLMVLSGLPEGLDTPITWLDPPPSFAWERARQRLLHDGLITDTGHLTDVGQAAAKLPLDSQWARLLCLSPRKLHAPLCQLYALASSRKSLFSSSATPQQIERRQNDLGRDPWRGALALLSLGHPERHGLNGETLDECKRLVQDLLSYLGSDNPFPEKFSHIQELKRFLARYWPQAHFVRRVKRNAWTNGIAECRPTKSETLSPEDQAAVFLSITPIQAQARKVELLARWPLPIRFKELLDAGYGQPRLGKATLGQGKISVEVELIYGGRILGVQKDTPKGPLLRQALADLASRNVWQTGLWGLWEDHAYYTRLHDQLHGKVGECTASDLFLEHLSQLGVESEEDLSLLERPDLEPDTHHVELLASLKKAYPRHYSYGGVAYDVHYQPQARSITLHFRSGPRSVQPPAQHLPHWNGWRVHLDIRGRVTPLR